MKRTVVGLIATGGASAVVLLVGGLVPAAASAQSGGQAQSASSAQSAGTAPGSGRPVIVIGIDGLRWTDVSAAATPAIWRLAETGAVGSLVTTTINPVTCPADAWLTLNSGARAAARPLPSGQCPALPAVRPHVLPPPHVLPRQSATTAAGGPDRAASTGPADIPAMTGPRGLIRYNEQFRYSPDWGVLAHAAGTGRCATAIGPGAALALASPVGDVPRYLPGLPGASRLASDLMVVRQCPLTMIDLGALPPPGAASGGAAAVSTARSGAARSLVLGADDQAVGAVVAAAPAGAIVMLASAGDSPGPHLGVVVVSGPGYRTGLLTSASTRQPGIVAITDLTPSIFDWRSTPIPKPVAPAVPLTGTTLTAGGRGSLAAVVKTMIGQDTANQVYRSIVGWFFLYYGVAEGALFALIALALRGEEASRSRRRVAAYCAAATFTAAVPAGTYLAGLVPWSQLPHPAVVLYGLGFAWAAVIGAVALAGPWRRDPFGPPGFVAAVTLAVIAIDVMTGSRLQLGAPFGLSLLEAGRFYGVGNNALGVYAAAGILTAAWAAAAVLRRAPGSRRLAAAAAGGVALVTVIASGWPGFGAKVGGTIAMVPAFLLLLAVVAGVRITVRRALLIGVSGLVLVTVFATVDYLVPAIGASHLGTFVGSVLHGQAGGTLQRKISSNLKSLTTTWFTPVVPVVAVVTGLMLAWPARLRLRTFVAACSRAPLLRTSLFATWLAVVLSWLVDDSGVSTAAAALPIALPLAIALVVRVVQLTGGAGDTVAGSAQTVPSRQDEMDEVGSPGQEPATAGQ